MGFAPRIYEIHLWKKDKHGDYWWEVDDVAYSTYDKALSWYEKYKVGGMNVRIVETKVVRAWEDGIEYT